MYFLVTMAVHQYQVYISYNYQWLSINIRYILVIITMAVHLRQVSYSLHSIYLINNSRKPYSLYVLLTWAALFL